MPTDFYPSDMREKIDTLKQELGDEFIGYGPLDGEKMVLAFQKDDFSIDELEDYFSSVDEREDVEEVKFFVTFNMELSEVPDYPEFEEEYVEVIVES